MQIIFRCLLILLFFLQAIVPKKGQTKAPRLRAMDRDYHLECFKWVDRNDDDDSGDHFMI